MLPKVFLTFLSALHRKYMQKAAFRFYSLHWEEMVEDPQEGCKP